MFAHMAKTQPSQAAKDLKALRIRLGVHLKDCAKAIGKGSPGSYQHYEDRLKDPKQPLWVIKGLAPLFLAKGATIEEMAALGGIPPQSLSDIVEKASSPTESVSASGTLHRSVRSDANAQDTLDRDALREAFVSMALSKRAGAIPELPAEQEAERLLRYYDAAVRDRARKGLPPK